MELTCLILLLLFSSLQSMNLTAYDLTVDMLDVHAVSNPFLTQTILLWDVSRLRHSFLEFFRQFVIYHFNPWVKKDGSEYKYSHANEIRFAIWQKLQSFWNTGIGFLFYTVYTFRKVWNIKKTFFTMISMIGSTQKRQC